MQSLDSFSLKISHPILIVGCFYSCKLIIPKELQVWTTSYCSVLQSPSSSRSRCEPSSQIQTENSGSWWLTVLVGLQFISCLWLVNPPKEMSDFQAKSRGNIRCCTVFHPGSWTDNINIGAIDNTIKGEWITYYVQCRECFAPKSLSLVLTECSAHLA